MWTPLKKRRNGIERGFDFSLKLEIYNYFAVGNVLIDNAQI
jgi:hypothetical protein